MKRILWLKARLPYPLRSGDALYSAGLLRACCAAGHQVRVIGSVRTPDTSTSCLQGLAKAEWRPLASVPRPTAMSLISALPKDAFILNTAAMVAQIKCELRSHWDWIVFDHAYSAGSLDLVLNRRGDSRIAYIAHNVEGLIRPRIAREIYNFLAPLYRLDAAKYRHLEHRLIRSADVVTAITSADAEMFRSMGALVHEIPPLYQGPIVRNRIIGNSVPRRVMLLGSFDWIAKQHNLERFLCEVGARLAGADVGVDVVGNVASRLRQKLERVYSNVRFWGVVDDVLPCANQVRCAVIPECLGGGLKLKLLDYAFMRAADLWACGSSCRNYR